MSSYKGQAGKSRGPKAKPVLRKLKSEQNSLDLDRPAAEQDGLGIFDYHQAAGARSSHDIIFAQTGRRGYHHRSTSGTSQFSTTTTGSGHRAGSFVHPFQQTPRPYTPPLVASASYQNSLRESEFIPTTGDSPAPTEDESERPPPALRSSSNLSNRSPSITSTTSPVFPQPLRILTKHSLKASSSRLALATSQTSQTSLNLHTTATPPDLTSPSETMSPLSSIRTSLDKGFRIRSHSEMDYYSREEQIRKARADFVEKERRKDEKTAQEEIRKMEKADEKQARKIVGGSGHRRSSASDAARSKRSRSRSDLHSMQEKDINGFAARSYTSHAVLPPIGPTDEDVPSPRLRYTAKRATNSAWAKFVMWLRTRFLRMSKSRT